MASPKVAPAANDLALVEEWKRSIAECRDLDQLKTIRNKAEALRTYFRKIEQSQRSQNAAAEVKVRAERRMGELLRDDARRAGRPSKNGNTMLPLSDIGISKIESSRCQMIAWVPDDEFRRIVTEAVRDNRELTSAELYRLGLRHRRLEEKRRRLSTAAGPGGGAATGGEPGIIGPDPEATWQIWRADCLEFLPTMADGSARLIFADPPYNIGVDYGGHYDDDRPADEYEEWCEAWLAELHRVATDDGSLWLLINHEWSARLQIAAEEIGFHLRQFLTWYESFGVNTTRMFNRCSRPLLWLVKDPRRFYFDDMAKEIRRESDRAAKYGDARANPLGKVWDDVWGINPPIPRVVGTGTERLPDFPTQLPLSLLRPIIACASEANDLVLDPFSGSGTTGATCIEKGRRFIGIELSEEFADLSRLRLTAHEKEHTHADTPG